MIIRKAYIIILLFSCILVSGFYLRFESAKKTYIDHPLSHDAGQYFQYAYNLRHHHVYSKDIGVGKEGEQGNHPDALRTPGYPLFLSILINDVPNQKILSRIVLTQCILSVLTILFVFLLFNRFLSPLWSVAVAIIVAVSPHLIVFNSYVLSETLFCFCIVFLSWLVSLFVEKPGFYFAVLIGVVCGVSALVRPSMNFFPAVLFFVLIFMVGGKKGLKLFAGILIGFVLIMAPWFARNMVTLNKVSDGTLMVNFLHHGMYPNFMKDDRPETFGFPYRFDPRSDKISRNTASVLKEIKSRFHDEPLKYLKWYIIQKPKVFWSWGMIQGYDIFVYMVSASPYFTDSVFQWSYLFMKSVHNILVVLCAFGCVAAWFPIRWLCLPDQAVYTARFVSTLLIYFTLLHMMGAPFPRYSVPLRPFMYAMAMFVPVALNRTRRNGQALTNT
jgi:4-amino-4-deoxy-L-arabinose transferase-like glycosyltransferase